MLVLWAHTQILINDFFSFHQVVKVLLDPANSELLYFQAKDGKNKKQSSKVAYIPRRTCVQNFRV